MTLFNDALPGMGPQLRLEITGCGFTAVPGWGHSPEMGLTGCGCRSPQTLSTAKFSASMAPPSTALLWAQEES